MGIKEVIIAIAITLTFWLGNCAANDAEITWEQFFHAIGQVESNNDDSAEGDYSKKHKKYMAIGRYQIWEVYWFDAVERLDKDEQGVYNDVRKKKYAEWIMKRYWMRFNRKAVENKDWETLARIHNGGPKGHKKEATKKYWEKVKKCLQQ
tara:strand:+ start:302 stop:751 length:450 start_codon:yes stop_codon:yes gene_type:complete